MDNFPKLTVEDAKQLAALIRKAKEEEIKQNEKMLEQLKIGQSFNEINK